MRNGRTGYEIRQGAQMLAVRRARRDADRALASAALRIAAGCTCQPDTGPWEALGCPVHAAHAERYLEREQAERDERAAEQAREAAA